MTIIIAILALGLLIVLHEAGHFLAARWCGMRVYEFSIGFGPKIWSIKRGETEYSLRAIFLGGYVRVAGMHPAEEDVDAEGSFLRSAPWKRFLMISAGPAANYLTAIGLFVILFVAWGQRDPSVKVRKAATKAAGIQTGDKILSINGKPIRDRGAKTPHHSFVTALNEIYSAKKSKLTLTIQRDGKPLKVVFPKMDKKAWKTLGLSTKDPKKPRLIDANVLTVKALSADSLATRAGLRKGDVLVSIGKIPLDNENVLKRMIREKSKQGFVLNVRRNGEALRLHWPKDAPKKMALGLTTKTHRVLRVKQLEPGSLAQAAGLEPGDHITAVNGKALDDRPYRSAVDQVAQALAQCRQQNKATPAVVLRNGQRKKLSLDPKAGACAAGLSLRPTLRIAVMQVQPKSTAAQIGLKAGDWIHSIDGVRIHSMPMLLKHLSARIYRPVKVRIERKGKLHTLTAPTAKDAKSWKLGFAPQLDYPRKRVGPIAALRAATLQTWQLNVEIFRRFGQLFKGKAKADFAGPIGIVQMARTSFKHGFDFFLHFVAIISISLAFFNLIPFPALDGGRLMFLFLQQMLRLFGGKEEIGIRIEMVANLIGFVLLFGLLIFISFKDILR